MSTIHRRLAGAWAIVLVLAVETAAHADDPLARPVDRVTVIQAALRGHPALLASEQRARASALAADAEGRLPPPETMMQIWQVPIAKPYALGDAGMIMFGVGQTFPSPGARGARARAGAHLAAADRAMTAERARIIRRDAEHAFAEYLEATSRHRIHVEHRTVAERTLALARARHAGGAALSDVAQAEVEVARIEADVVTDRTRIEGARARVNALLGRDPSAALGPASEGEPEIATWDLAAMTARARETRPELRAASALREAQTEEARAAAKEATFPTFSVAALYFAPTSVMPEHGYGLNASMSLPWLWGEARARRAARNESAAAATSEVTAARIPVSADVAVAEANVRAAALRFSTLRDRALPASQRAFDIAWAGYESGRTDVLTLLSTRRAVVDVENEIVVARATLDHALAEIDAAVGMEVPRRPLGPTESSGLMNGGDHGK